MDLLRTYIYIDGFNLYYGQVKGTPYKWLDLDALCRAYLSAKTNNILKIKYFTAIVKPRPKDPDQGVRQQIYIRALKTIPHIEIIYGHFLSHEVNMPLAGSTGFVRVIKTEEKKSDVNIAVHMLHDAYKDNYDLAVLVSNDSDLSEALRIIKNELGKKIGILNPQKIQSRELGKYALFQKQIRQRALAACQFPIILHDKTGKITKPVRW
ncbi:MAG: NYN domain-containing protein [Spirochaetaceae bacterium]|nr:MAG: NYN domain-containing protein [Spirochaetaceae bacterium]